MYQTKQQYLKALQRVRQKIRDCQNSQNYIEPGNAVQRALQESYNCIENAIQHYLCDNPAPCPLTFVPCTVNWHYTALLVTFENGNNLLLQVDTDQNSFIEACGRRYNRHNAGMIQYCPDDYYALAESQEPADLQIGHLE
jgi:hypothetical protein